MQSASDPVQHATERKVPGLTKTLAPNVQREVDAVQVLIDKAFPDEPPLTVLEAGCGSLTRVTFGGRAWTVGIDISPEQLEHHPALDERILGDVQEFPLPSEAYDAIVCWYVFEHLPRPDLALRNFARAIRPGGLIIIAVPDLLSPKALVTKYSPHWFHVWVYRHVFGSRTAGLPGHAPFPTELNAAVRPQQLVNLAEQLGLEVVTERRWEDPKQLRLRERVRIVGCLWRVLRATLRRLSFNRIDPELTEYLIVLRPRRTR